MGFLLLGLLGTAVVGALAFDWFDDDDTADSEDNSPEVEGQELYYDGSDLLEGTEGDDVLPAGQDTDLAPDTINLLGGDDTAVVEDPFGITVFGGDGDDTLTSTAVANILNGGAGNDILTGIDATSMSGGDGDDEINFNSDVDLNDVTARLSGGDGNDTINVTADAGVITADRGGAIIEGGEGSDEFNIILDLQNSQEEAINLHTSIARINDFTPDEDTLVIEIDRNDETADRDVMVELDQTEENGTFTSLITLTFEETDEATEAIATLKVISASAFSMDDIQLIGV